MTVESAVLELSKLENPKNQDGQKVEDCFVLNATLTLLGAILDRGFYLDTIWYELKLTTGNLNLIIKFLNRPGIQTVMVGDGDKFKTFHLYSVDSPEYTAEQSRNRKVDRMRAALLEILNEGNQSELNITVYFT